MCLINYCFRTSININIISSTLLEVPIRINKCTANAYTYYGNYGK